MLPGEVGEVTGSTPPYQGPFETIKTPESLLMLGVFPGFSVLYRPVDGLTPAEGLEPMTRNRGEGSAESQRRSAHNLAPF